ncbi:hypothetical protein AGOR_G00236690 [Albula goreensis]|uniref:Fibronectin type-III domain-containing protein n=1 Tax=Albula goreensis TaxID=1534307 RepID=A0A8T3CCG8_9TELE|nr:hypothetical protein AGOR_G00236690 [Albula goreensis]
MEISCYRRAGFLCHLLVSICATATGGELPPGPELQDCVLIQTANITCRWGPAQYPSPGTTFTLQVNRTDELYISRHDTKECRTEQTHCSVPFKSMSTFYCLRVTAHSAFGDASSSRLCLHGTTIVKLFAPTFVGFSEVPRQPNCLKIQWQKPPSFGPSSYDITAGYLDYQLWYSTKDRIQVTDVDLRDRQTVLCLFSPFTLYVARIRCRFNSTPYWSEWSTALQARTVEAAPSVAPELWSQMEPAGQNGWRRAVLLWKPVPQGLANGKVLWYNVSCWVEEEERGGDATGIDLGECAVLDPSNTSCWLSLPPRRCTCVLSAHNSAGSSPHGHITIPSPHNTVVLLPQALTVTPLDDNSLEVRWTAPKSQPASGFVVSWRAVPEIANCSPCWLKLNGSTRHSVITEGVEPGVRYRVCVSAHYAQESAQALMVEAYSREGAPSAGPSLHVMELGSGRVGLKWDPVPVEQQRGFLLSYTLHWRGEDKLCHRVSIPRDHLMYTLTGHDSSLLVWFVLSFATLILLGLLMALSCLQHRESVRQHLWPKVPDPARSSLSVWISNILLGKKQGPHAHGGSGPGLTSQGKGAWQQCPLVVTPTLQHGHNCCDPGEGSGYLTVLTLPTYSRNQSESSTGTKPQHHGVINYSYWVSDKKDRLNCSYTTLCITEPPVPCSQAQEETRRPPVAMRPQHLLSASSVPSTRCQPPTCHTR